MSSEPSTELTTPNAGSYDDTAVTAAIRRYEERLVKDPASLVFATLADLYRKAGRLAEAAALCRDGLERFPQYTTARLILARTLLDAGEDDAALGELGAIVTVSPEDVQCRRLLAEAERRRGDVDAAIRHLEAAVALDPGDREARATLMLLTASPGEPPATGMARVLRDDTFVTVTFGHLCLEQGLIEEAATIFTRLLRKDSTNRPAREGLEQALRVRSGRKRA
jgi:tetratricopeptide (TPR) repeat protein